MSVELSITTKEIAALVKENSDLKSQLINLWLAKNSVSLTISDLTDSISLDSTSAEVAVGESNTINITSSGDGDLSAASADEKIVTAEIADGALKITGVAAGSAQVSVNKGDASASVAVTVKAAE